MPSREPSMEDILASIKRVIAEEKEIRAAAPPPLHATAEAEEDEDEGRTFVAVFDQHQPGIVIGYEAKDRDE